MFDSLSHSICLTCSYYWYIPFLATSFQWKKNVKQHTQTQILSHSLSYTHTHTLTCHTDDKVVSKFLLDQLDKVSSIVHPCLRHSPLLSTIWGVWNESYTKHVFAVTGDPKEERCSQLSLVETYQWLQNWSDYPGGYSGELDLTTTTTTTTTTTRIQRCNSRFFTISSLGHELSPTRTLIVRKSCATHPALITCNALFYWLNHSSMLSNNESVLGLIDLESAYCEWMRQQAWSAPSPSVGQHTHLSQQICP